MHGERLGPSWSESTPGRFQGPSGPLENLAEIAATSAVRAGLRPGLVLATVVVDNSGIYEGKTGDVRVIGRHDVRVRVPDGEARVIGEFRYLATNVVVEYAQDLLVNRALEGLEDARAHREVYEALEAGWVAAARASGASWAMIGQVLGMTGDGARRKFAAVVGGAS